MPDSLNSIRVHQRTIPMSHLSNFRDGLNRAHFVVGQHHRDERCARNDHALRLFSAYAPRFIDIQPCNFRTAWRKRLTRAQHSVVLHTADDNAPPLIAFRTMTSGNRPVVRFRAA